MHTGSSGPSTPRRVLTREELADMVEDRDERIAQMRSVLHSIAAGEIDEGGNRRNHPRATAMARSFLGLAE